MSVLAIDPGLDTGWAFLDDAGALVMCGLGNPPDSVGHPVIIERPQVYRGRSSKGDPNDLITLAIQVGRYTERMSKTSKVEHVLPRDWKGTVKPDVLCHRIVSRLTSTECAMLFHVLKPHARKPIELDAQGAHFCDDPDNCGLVAGKRHNVIDAVGLAIWSAGSRLVARFR